MDYFVKFSENKSPREKGFYYTPNKKQTSISELHHALSASTTFDLNNLRSNIRSFAASLCFKKPQNNISRVLLTFSVLLYKFLMTIRRWNFESETFLWRWYIFHSWKTNIGMIFMQDFIWLAQITDIRMTKKKEVNIYDVYGQLRWMSLIPLRCFLFFFGKLSVCFS